MLLANACGSGSGGSGTPSFTVSTTAGIGGSISPASTTVRQGSSTSFTVAAEPGLEIATVTGCGGTLAGSTYTTGPVTTDCTVTAEFIGPRFAYVTNIDDDTVSMYTVSTNSGALRHNGYVSTGRRPRDVTLHSSGQFVYVANRGSGDVSAYTIDAATGVLTEISGAPFVAGDQPFSVTVYLSGQFVYVAKSSESDVSAYTIDPASGALTMVLGAPFVAGDLSRSVATTGTIQ